jgi:MoaA/NifB/PqqE/SkfB family radical SAM enzyme
MEGDNTEYVQTHSVDEWRDSYIHQTARQELAKNEWPASCVKCKVDEEQGLVSQRLKPSIYGPGITHLDLRFSNSCNLSCSMCSPGSSNTIYHEHKKIIAINKESPWTTLEPANIDWYDEDRINKLLESLPDVKQIYLTGGEPFMVKGILHFLQRLDSDTQLRFNTNATIINPKVFNELKRFHKTVISFSIDGVGAVNNYIRWGSKWSEITENIKKFRELPGHFSISTTVQLLNSIHMEELKDWASSENLQVHETVLMFPKHYNISNANDSLKSRIEGYDSVIAVPADPLEQENFIKYTKTLDTIRNCNIANYLPEIAGLYGIN